MSCLFWPIWNLSTLGFWFPPHLFPCFPSIICHTWNNHLLCSAASFFLSYFLKSAPCFCPRAENSCQTDHWGVQFCLSSLCFLSLLGSCGISLLKLRHLSTCSHLGVVLFNRSLNTSAGTGMGPHKAERWQHWESKTESIWERAQEWVWLVQGSHRSQSPHLAQCCEMLTNTYITAELEGLNLNHDPSTLGVAHTQGDTIPTSIIRVYCRLSSSISSLPGSVWSPRRWTVKMPYLYDVGDPRRADSPFSHPAAGRR